MAGPGCDCVGNNHCFGQARLRHQARKGKTGWCNDFLGHGSIKLIILLGALGRGRVDFKGLGGECKSPQQPIIGHLHLPGIFHKAHNRNPCTRPFWD